MAPTPMLPFRNPAVSPALRACTPADLAALGPLLCLHDAFEAHPMAGWSRASGLVASIRLDSDGPCEALRFTDAAGDCCWQLHLLPDSDFLAWERLIARLPVEADAARPWRGGLWPWRRGVSRWRACALRLHALPGLRGDATRLAAADTVLSPLGRACADRLARQAGAGGDAGETRAVPHGQPSLAH